MVGLPGRTENAPRLDAAAHARYGKRRFANRRPVRIIRPPPPQRIFSTRVYGHGDVLALEELDALYAREVVDALVDADEPEPRS